MQRLRLRRVGEGELRRNFFKNFAASPRYLNTQGVNFGLILSLSSIATSSHWFRGSVEWDACLRSTLVELLLAMVNEGRMTVCGEFSEGNLYGGVEAGDL